MAVYQIFHNFLCKNINFYYFFVKNLVKRRFFTFQADFTSCHYRFPLMLYKGTDPLTLLLLRRFSPDYRKPSWRLYFLLALLQASQGISPYSRLNGGPGWDRTNRAVRHLIYSQVRYLLRDTDPYKIVVSIQFIPLQLDGRMKLQNSSPMVGKDRIYTCEVSN